MRTWTRILDHLDEELDDVNEDDLDLHDLDLDLDLDNVSRDNWT